MTAARPTPEMILRLRAAHNDSNPAIPMRPAVSSISAEQNNFTCALQTLIEALNHLSPEFRGEAKLDAIRRLADLAHG